jgi:hypothetical protein
MRRTNCGLLVFDEKVIAEKVEVIGIEAGFVGGFEAFSEFDVEDLEAQSAGGVAVFYGVGKTQAIAADFGVNAGICRPRRSQGKDKFRNGDRLGFDAAG